MPAVRAARVSISSTRTAAAEANSSRVTNRPSEPVRCVTFSLVICRMRSLTAEYMVWIPPARMAAVVISTAGASMAWMDEIAAWLMTFCPGSWLLWAANVGPLTGKVDASAVADSSPAPHP